MIEDEKIIEMFFGRSEQGIRELDIKYGILLTMRPLDERGAWAVKSKKEYVLDEKGERVKLPSGRYKTRKVDLVDWNNQENAEVWRAAWADLANAYLERNDSPERIDHRSYERQGIDQIPTVHVGVAACQMEKKGIAIATLAELDAALSAVREKSDTIREGMKTAEKRMKELQKLIEYGKNYTEYKPIHDELKKLKNGWTSKRDKYEEAHRAELTLWNAASRYLHANLPKGTKTLPISEWEKEYATLSGQRTAEYTKLKETRAEVAELHNIRKCVDIALKADQPEQTRAKRHDLER